MELPTGTLQGNWKSPRNSSMIFTARHLHLQRIFHCYLYQKITIGCDVTFRPHIDLSTQDFAPVAGPASLSARHFWSDIFCIYFQKGTLSGPHFSTFLEMQCFCYILFDHLCSYTCYGITRDPHRLSDFLRGCQRMSRESWRFSGKRKEVKQT